MAQEKIRIFYKSFSKRKDACPSFYFLPEFQFRFSDAGAGVAAGSAAALKVPFCEVFQYSVAATVGEDKLARAAPVGAATDLLEVEAAVQEVATNSEGMGDTSGLHSIVLGDNAACGIAATDLHAASNSEGMGNAGELHGKVAFSLPDFEAHGGDVNILGDLGSIAFSVTREAVTRGSRSNSLHCHLMRLLLPVSLTVLVVSVVVLFVHGLGLVVVMMWEWMHVWMRKLVVIR